MSRQSFHRYLLSYLSVSAILTCGSSWRIPRRASCPSCSQDCPEALVSPWYPRRELNLQTKVLRDFPDTPIRNSPYFGTQGGSISQNIIYDDNILSNQDPLVLENYRTFPRRESIGDYPYSNAPSFRQFVNIPERRNLFFDGYSNKSPRSSDKQIFPREAPTNSYSFSPVLSSRQFVKDLSFNGQLNEYSESRKDQDLENNMENEADPANELLVVYRADRDPREISKDASSDLIAPRKPFAISRQENILDEDRNTIKKSINSVDQSEYNFEYPQERPYPTKSDVSEIERNPYMLFQNSYIRKPMKDGNFLGDQDSIMRKDSLEFPEVEQFKEVENNLLETYPTGETEAIIIEDNNKKIDYNSDILHQDLNIWRPTEKESLSNWNFAIPKDSQKITKVGQLETENNWLQEYPTLEENMRYFEDKKDKNKGYFNNDDIFTITDNISDETESVDYDSYSFPHDSNIWATTKNGEQVDRLNFTTQRNLQELQKTEQLKAYSTEETNNRYFQEENKNDMTENKISVKTKQTTSTPIINYDPYILSRYLNILNAAKYSVNTSKTKNPQERNTHIQDLTLSKNAFESKECNAPTVDGKSNVNTQDDLLTKFDPDLMDDIEDPPTEPTEPTPIKSLVEFSTPE